MHWNFGKVIYYQSCMSGFESDDDLLASHDQSFQNNKHLCRHAVQLYMCDNISVR